jgi:glutamyl-tRNA synthetase
MIGASLARLDEAVPMSEYLFTPTVNFTEEAIAQLRQDGSATAVEAVSAAIANYSPLTEATIQDLLKQVVKEQNLKKGLVMRTLRAALTGGMQGPDLVQSWLLLHQRGLDQSRLQQALEAVQSV